MRNKSVKNILKCIFKAEMKDYPMGSNIDTIEPPRSLKPQPTDGLTLFLVKFL